MSPQLARAAQFVADHPDRVAVGSMRSLARTLGVSPATMTRVTRQLGYASYAALRSNAAATLARQGGYAHRAQRLQDDARGVAQPTARLAAAQGAAVQSWNARNTEAGLQGFCRALLRARSVGFLGLRASHAVAFQLAYVYGFLFDNGLLIGSPAGTLADDVGRLGAADALVAISVAPYTRATIDCAREAAARGVRVLAITDSRSGPLAAHAKHALVVDIDSPSFFSTMTGLLACVEALVQQLALLHGERTVKRLASVDERLRKAGAYHDTGWRRNLKVIR